MWDAVVVPSRLENVILRPRVLATSSRVTVAKPVPGDATVGTSLAPLRLVAKIVTELWAAVALAAVNAKAATVKRKPFMASSFGMRNNSPSRFARGGCRLSYED